jgi:50S ribosomal protein L16 3-hydroxylase
MNVADPLPLLGGLTPAQFMKRHWQKKPLLVRQAFPGIQPPQTRAQLFALAADDDVESRCVQRRGDTWHLRQGPFLRRSLPAFGQPGWTLLVQGVDLHVPAAHRLMSCFRFVPDARLDDLMTSWASDGGGVGPHLDSYDVFLIQVQGRRRWRIGRVPDGSLIEGLPLKILKNFEPEQEWVLDAGDMLYLPPRWGHDGIAEGECMTCSVGFRVPEAEDLAGDLLQRLAEGDEDGQAPRLYRDPGQPAVEQPAELPATLVTFAREALQRRLTAPDALERALGEAMTEPKPRVWFHAGVAPETIGGLQLDPRTRMMYDDRHVFINGEAFRIGGRDARLLRRLADQRHLDTRSCATLSVEAAEVIREWLVQGWLLPLESS